MLFVLRAVTLFQSTPSARRATKLVDGCGIIVYISIHALREEGDTLQSNSINPNQQFQSTPSARRATTTSGFKSTTSLISIHALREEGDFIGGLVNWPSEISIHALREEGDTRLHRRSCRLSLFQSTPSARRATATAQAKAMELAISIHALREEGDLAILIFSDDAKNFNPRPPRGGRHARK